MGKDIRFIRIPALHRIPTGRPENTGLIGKLLCKIGRHDPQRIVQGDGPLVEVYKQCRRCGHQWNHALHDGSTISCLHVASVIAAGLPELHYVSRVRQLEIIARASKIPNWVELDRFMVSGDIITGLEH